MLCQTGENRNSPISTCCSRFIQDSAFMNRRKVCFLPDGYDQLVNIELKCFSKQLIKCENPHLSISFNILSRPGPTALLLFREAIAECNSCDEM